MSDSKAPTEVAAAGADTHTIVVALDASEGSQLAFQHALNLARERTGMSHLHVVTVDSGPDPMGQLELAAEAHHISLTQQRAKLKANLAQLLAGTEPPPQVTSHVLLGPAAKEILRVAQHVNADLIVVGTGDRPLFSRLFKSSVAAEVLHKASCPVLVFRPKSWDAPA